jgi:hypothetical protein
MKRKKHYREKVQFMPRLKNDPPYEHNEIVKWFATLYGVKDDLGLRYFTYAKILSNKSANPFLVFDRQTREWHGTKIP